MVFTSKKNSEVLILTKSIREDVDLLCKAVVDAFEKLESKLALLDTQMKSLDKKLDDIGEVRHEFHPRRSCCSNCTIS